MKANKFKKKTLGTTKISYKGIFFFRNIYYTYGSKINNNDLIPRTSFHDTKKKKKTCKQ